MCEFRAACIQNTATREIEANVEWVCNAIDEAVAGGARFIALPEDVRPEPKLRLTPRRRGGEDPALR